MSIKKEINYGFQRQVAKQQSTKVPKHLPHYCRVTDQMALRGWFLRTLNNLATY